MDPPPAPFAHAAAASPLLDRQLAVLSELMESGLCVVLDVQRQITGTNADGTVPAGGPAAAPRADLPKLVLAFDRAARAVRMTVALQFRLEQEARSAAAGLPAQEARGVAAGQAEVLAIEHERPEAEFGERRERERAERLADADEFAAIMGRPVEEIVALICHDLGLEIAWPGMSEEAWALQALAAGQGRAPAFAGEGGSSSSNALRPGGGRPRAASP